MDGGDPVRIRVPAPLAVADRDERDAWQEVDVVGCAADVETAVKRGHDGDLRVPGELEPVRVDMGVDDVEPVDLVPRPRDGHLVVERQVAGHALAPERTRDDRHDLARQVRIAGGEHRDAVTALVQTQSERRDDPLRAGVHGRGKGQDGRGDDRDPQLTRSAACARRARWKGPHVSGASSKTGPHRPAVVRFVSSREVPSERVRGWRSTHCGILAVGRWTRLAGHLHADATARGSSIAPP